MTDFNAMTDALVACDDARLTTLVNNALADGAAANDILNRGLIAGMDIVGEKMENGDMFIPEVLMAAQAMGNCVTILKPLLGEGEGSGGASVVIGTVKGDLHDIGKILVGGAPVTQAFADEIGADGFAADAGSASKLAKSLAA